MITEADLQEAISECLGQRNPSASTCIKLAAFYTIRKELFGSYEPAPVYSRSSGSTNSAMVGYTSDTEFAQSIHGKDPDTVWAVVDELMEALRVVNPRLYRGVINKIEEG